ncbi:glycosyl transferase family protein [Mesorhizobium sp. J18]|uniref:glycosyl transferase family protein n=1 Tax=Mesorhizobium sp. J18 TaxID=935263 RepID=UPI001FEFAFA2|nr:glycosyl transferase family protein [Mesorhizobium sp. J18]
MGRLRLLIALDALLVEGSVSKAAERLAMGTPAMSRLLAQIRETYGDPILLRRGRTMVPTPFAEQLRLRLRALATEAEALLESTGTPGLDGSAPASKVLSRPLLKAPPLAMRRTVSLEGEPSPEQLARRLNEISADAEPQRRLAKHIATIGGGAGRSRPLTMDEADEAMSIILDGKADPIQIGALFIAMQYRGIVAPELAGLARAAQRKAGALPFGDGSADLDWPAYLSPRRGSAPWFLFSAKLLANSGRKVLLHGFGGDEGYLSEGLKFLGIPICGSIMEARSCLEKERIAFLGIGAVSAQLRALVGLYALFEMRSPLNLLVHLLNPLGARSSLLGVPAQPYREIMRDAAALLGWQNLTIIANSRDVAQFTPFRTTELIRLVRGEPRETIIKSAPQPPRQAKTGLNTMEFWKAVWEGAARDEHAVEVVSTTTAVGLGLLEGDAMMWEKAYSSAKNLWSQRP